MNPDLFLADLEEKPQRLRELAGVVDRIRPEVGTGPVLLLGMGSSHYANQVAAARMRTRGVAAVAELASTDLLPPVTAATTVLAVSASGGSVETLDAVDRLDGAHVVAVVNRPGSELAGRCAEVLDMVAGEERGGVACRSFQHTLALLCGMSAQTIVRAAEATEDLLERRDAWLPPVSELLLGPDGTWIAAPARRLSSAMQSALMLREGPRLPAVGCETGDWSHVDVYLTKTLDYRLLLLGGSRWEPQLLEWTGMRGTTVVAVGTELPAGAAAYTLRYRHDEDDDVRLLTETLVAELMAAAAWSAQAG